jgi:hypothetical protein
MLREEREEYVEKVLITRLWITISQKECPEAVLSLHELFSLIMASVKKPISSAAAHGAHTVRGSLLNWKIVILTATVVVETYRIKLYFRTF